MDLTYSLSSYISKSSTNFDDVNALTSSDLSADGLAWSGSSTQVNVTNYGATGNGSTNDTTAIVNAIAATPSGATLYFPPGTYMVSSTITIPGNIRLLGSYLGQSNIKLTSGFSAVDPMFTSAFNGVSGTYLSSNIRFENLVFDGNNNSSRNLGGNIAGYLLQLVQINNLKIIKCGFINNTYTAVALAGNSGVDIWGSKFANCGIPLPNTDSSPALFVGGTSNAAGANTTVNVNKCVFRNNKWSGIYFFPTGGSVKNSLFVNNGESSIFSNNESSNITFENNYFYGATRTNISASALELGGTNLTIRNNFFRNSGADGLSLTNVKTALVENNTSYDNGQELSYPSFANASGFTVTTINGSFYQGNTEFSENVTFRYNRSYNSAGSSTQAYGLSFYKNKTLQVETSTFNNNNFYNNSTSSIGNLNSGYNPSTVTFSGNISSSSDTTAGASVVSIVDNFVRSLAVTITTTEVPYGSNFLQRVDLLVPSTSIKGVVMWIHGGGWAGGAKSAIGFTSGQAAFIDNDDSGAAASIRKVAEAGFVVVNCAYRLTSPSSDGYGGDRTGGYPNAITDIETILRYCMVSGAGASASASWQTIYNYVANYGMIVAGASAGGHLAVQSVGKYGTSSGKWPVAVINLCGPMDIVYNDTNLVIPPALQTAVNLFSDPSDITGSTKNTNNLIAASPRYQYGTSASPGPWYSALNASNCKFYFIQNTNDTLVTSAMVTPFINSLPPTKVVSSTVTEGTAIPGVLNHNFTTPASTFVINIANSKLPMTPTPTFSPSSYVSFVAVTNASGLDWYMAEGLYTATVTLTTSGIPAGTELYWTTLSVIGTLTADDFTDGLIQGRVTIDSQGKGIITRNARADLLTEGSELFKLEIRETGYDSPVIITSTSSSGAGVIGIGDSSTTPEVTPTYAVSAAANSVNEGSSLTFTVTTTNVTSPTTLYWSLSNTTDFATSSGTVIINSNTGSFSVTPTADATTEVTAETFTASISTTNGGSAVATSGSVTINDTSQTPAPTYNEIVTMTSPIQRGAAVSFTITGGKPSTNYSFYTPYTNSSGQLNSSGNASGTIPGNAHPVAGTYNYEWYFSDTTHYRYVSVTATAPPITYVSLVGISDNSSNSATINEGQYTATFTLTTTDAQDGTVVYWTTLGSIAVGTITADDFTDGLLQGTATISGNTATITRTARADLTTEGSDVFRLEIRETSYTSQVKVTSGPVVISDTSTTPPATVSTTYDSFVGVSDLPGASTTLYEGQYTATFTLTTTGGAGKTVYWTTLGSVTYGTMTTDDFTDGQLQGTVTIGSNGIATITRSARADLFTDGIEVFSLEIRETGYTSPVKITSNSIGIIDSSTTPAPSYTSFVGVTDGGVGYTWYIAEGQYTATFTLNTANIQDGTVVYWTTLAYAGSIAASDFTDGLLQGTTTINNNRATIIRTARADLTTEGNDAFKLEIRETGYDNAVKITSTSSSPTNAIYIGDSSTTPAASPTYAVAAPQGVTSVNEGASITFTVTTTNVSDATQLYWSLSNTTDFVTSSGTVVINGNTGSFSVIPTADATTEVTAEIFTASISTTNGGSAVATSGSITINDTSQTLATPTYAVAAAGGATSVNEGASLTFNVTTTNVTTGTILNWALSNTTDFVTSSGPVTITVPTGSVNGTGSFTVTPTADATTEPVAELFIASIYTGAITNTPVASSGSITINDTSKTPGVAITYTSLIPDSGGTVLAYEVSLTADGSVGSPTVTFTLTTANAPDNTVVYWTTTGYLGSTPSASDFTDNTLQGTATIVGNTARIVRTVRQDYTTEDLYEYYRLEIRETSYTEPVKIISQYVAIVDKSQPPTDVTITPTTSSVDEGASLLVAVTTVGVVDFSVLYWSVSRPGDFAVSSGPFTIVSNAGSFSVTPTADQLTEGAETFTISILSDPIGGLFSPTVFKTSSLITINDTSLTRTYSITPSATSVNEGTKIDFTVNTTNVPTGTVLYWSVSNSGDFSNSAGQVTTGSNGSATFSVTPVLDYVTEGAETFTASISLTNGGAAVFTTSAITINDIIGQPTYTITPVATTVTEGTALRFDISTTNVPAGTTLYWTVTNPVTVAPPPTPVYIITPVASSVNEGASLRINVSGSNIPDGTYYWTIGTNAGDFGVTSGNFTITSNAGFFNVSPTADTATEGAETFTVSIRTDSITGTPVVTTNPAITINDTSQAPVVPTYLVSTTSTSVNEGSPITFTVSTTNVTTGTSYNWAVSNKTDFAISDGTVTITVPSGSVNGTGTFTVTPNADASTEGAETFTASIYTGSIQGLPLATSGQITINDTSQTPVAATYAVAAANGATSINEGTPITFNVTTTNIVNGTTLNWAINNLLASNAADFSATSGTVTINTPNGSVNGTGSFMVTPLADATTETVIEKFTVAVYAGSITGTSPVATSGQITINDTSQTPPPPTYIVTPAANSVNEGASLTFTVTTTNLASPTTLYWAVLTNAGDFTDNSGTVTITTTTGVNGAGTFTVTPTADATTEGSETFTVGIRTSAVSTFNEATSSAVTIVDTSLTPPPSPTYAVAPSNGVTSIDEGSPLTFNVTTTNVATGTTLYWAYKNGSADAADLTLASGFFTINNLGQGTFIVTPVADATTEGPQTFSISVRTSPAPANEVTSSISVIINDTSLTPVPPESAVYALAPTGNVTSVNEGSPIEFTVSTINILNNTPLYWSVNNAGDFGISSGTVIINTPNGSVNGTGTFTVTPIADATTEGPETFRATIRSVSSSGNVEAISIDVTINDTSKTPVISNPPTYSVTPNASTVNEGVELTFTVTTTNVAANTILSWSISNSGDFGVSSGFVTIDSNGTGTFKVTPALDLTTEGPESFTAYIFTSSNIVDPVATSPSVTIVDTSQGAAPPPPPEYSIVPAALAVNEGTPLIITVNTLNVDDNTRLYWSINNVTTGNADFVNRSGSVLIVGGTGSFSITPTQDNLVESSETFTVTIRTVSASGDPVLTSDPITINAAASQSLLLGQTITPTIYNNARTQIAGVLGVTTTGQVGATQGYGQVLASLPVSQHEKITEAHLDNLRLDITKTTIHQSGTDPNLVNVALGNVELADVFDSYSVLATTCNTLKDQIGLNQLATTSYTQTATYSAYTGTPNTGGGWKNYAFYELTVTFSTADAARYFFNAGSSFKFSASRTGGTIAPTVGLNQNTSWTNLLLDVTADNPAFAKNDFYALGTAYSTVYNKNSTGIYSANYYRISAKSNVADNSYGGATVVTFKIEFVDAFNDGNTSNYDGVDGIFESVVVRNMPKGMDLGGAISVAAPTSVLPTPSNAFTVDGTPIYITATYQITASPTSVTEAGATINFTFTASNYNVPNMVTWFITATTQTGLSDFVETGWTTATTIDGYKQLIKVTPLTPTSTFKSSITTASIVTNPDSTTEGTETFTVTAVPMADGSGGGTPSDPVTITVTDSSKTPTPGYTWTLPTVVGPATELSCIPGEGLGAVGYWGINSVALTGAAALVIYGIYLDISANSNINSYKMTLWDGTVLTESDTTFYTLPTPKSIANGASVTFTVQVGSTSGNAGDGTVRIRFRSNAGSADGTGPNIVGPSYNSAIQSVSVRIVAPTVSLSVTASPASVSFYYITGNTGSASTEITVTNNGNARATLSNYNVSNPGGGSVSAGLISGLILAGASKTTTVTYSSSSAIPSGTSTVSITGNNNLIGTTSASRNISVIATQAFGIISPRFSLASSFTGQAGKSNTFILTIDNNGLAALTVTAITVTPGTFMSATPVLLALPFTIPAGGSRTTSYFWSRSNIGSTLLSISITSDTGGIAGTSTSLSETFSATGLIPSVSVTSNNGAVTNSYSFSTRAVIKKLSHLSFSLTDAEPNGYMWIAPQWESGLMHQYLIDVNITTPTQFGPDSTNPAPSRQTLSSTGTTTAWGTYTDETKYWRTGIGKIWLIIQNGKFDNGTQSYYVNPFNGSGKLNYIEVEIIPNMKQTLYLDTYSISNLDPGTNTITNPKYWWSMAGGPSDGIMYYKGSGTSDTNYPGYNYEDPANNNLGATQLDASGFVVMGDGAEWSFNIRTISRQFRATYKGTEYVSDIKTATVNSPAFFPQPGGGAWVSPDPSYAPDIDVWYRFLRRLSPLVVGRVYRLDTSVDDLMWSVVTTDQDGALFPSFQTLFGTGGTASFTATKTYAILTWVVKNTGGPGNFKLTVTDTVTNSIVYSTTQGGAVAWS